MAKILIVEDDPNIARYIAEIALSIGHHTLIADSAPKATSLLETEHEIAAMILDHHLGDKRGNGLAFLTHVRQSTRYRNLPAIICTGDTKAETIGGFVSLSVFAFLKKPFRAARLLEELERLFAPPPPLGGASSQSRPPRLARIIRGSA